MNVYNLMNIFAEIEKTSSKNEKEQLLERFKDEEGFQDVLKFVYNPFIVTGLAKKKISKDVPKINGNLHNFKDVMNYVTENNSGSNEVIAVVQNYLDTLTNEEREFAVNVLIKDLKVGMTEKTVNKVFGKNFIPSYNVMLASKWEDHAEKLKSEFQVSLKIDGIRCTCFNEVTGPKFFTRQGHLIEGLTELEKLFEKLPTGLVYDGELIAENVDNLSSDDLFRYTQKIARKDGIKTGLEFIAFDVLPIDEFINGESKQLLHERMFKLANIVLEADSKYLKLVPIYYVGADKEKVYEILDEVTKAGYEGLMVSPTNSKYVTKRARTLLKVKKFHTVDLFITGFEEHKHGDKLGSLIVSYKNFPVNVGSGFTDVERNELWQRRNELLDTIVEVGYFEESQNQNGGISLRFPTFKRLRPDKSTSSYN